MKFYRVRSTYLGSRVIIHALGYHDALRLHKKFGGKILGGNK